VTSFAPSEYGFPCHPFISAAEESEMILSCTKVERGPIAYAIPGIIFRVVPRISALLITDPSPGWGSVIRVHILEWNYKRGPYDWQMLAAIRRIYAQQGMRISSRIRMHVTARG
jgi:hypothetical protein